MFYATFLVLAFILKLRRTPRDIVIYIHSRYGETGLKLLRKLEFTERKLLKVRLDETFLVCCKVHTVIPKFLRFSSTSVACTTLPYTDRGNQSYSVMKYGAKELL